jgi:integrase
LSPDGLVEWQRVHPNEYGLLDLLQEYVRGKRGRASYKRNVYNVVRSFFGHNRAEMPRDRRFRIVGDEPSVVGRLGVEELKQILIASNRMYRAIFLCMFQAGMGIGELLYWDRTGLAEVRRQLREDRRLLRVELPGRKANRNKKPFYTFIGRDGQEALRAWLRVRPNFGGNIFYTNFGTPLKQSTVRTYWLRKLERLGLITRMPGGREGGIRYGKNLHELRDLFKTRWRLSGCDPEVADWFMGHDIDRLGYDKSPWEYPEWYEHQYLKAEPWLNILSEDPERVPVYELDAQKELVARMEQQLERVLAVLRLKGIEV